MLLIFILNENRNSIRFTLTFVKHLITVLSLFSFKGKNGVTDQGVSCSFDEFADKNGWRLETLDKRDLFG